MKSNPLKLKASDKRVIFCFKSAHLVQRTEKEVTQQII